MSRFYWLYLCLNFGQTTVTAGGVKHELRESFGLRKMFELELNVSQGVPGDEPESDGN